MNRVRPERPDPRIQNARLFFNDESITIPARMSVIVECIEHLISSTREHHATGKTTKETKGFYANGNSRENQKAERRC